MAKFLMAVWPIPGHYYPNLAVAHALRTRGHEVAFFTGKRARPVIEGEGFRCFPFQRIDERTLDKIFFSPRLAPPWWQHPLLELRARYYDWLVGALPGQVPDLKEVLQSWAPDVLVCDPTLWGPILVLHELYQIPLAIFAYVPFCPVPGPEVPPIGLGLPCPRNRRMRLWTESARLLIRLGTDQFRKAANALRREYGLPPIRVSVAEFTGQMPLYLVAGTRELDYGRRDLPATVHYIGPCQWERKRKGQPPKWLEKLPRDQPWVYVSEGTVHTQAPLLLPAAAQGLANLPMQVIMDTSTPGDPGELGLGPIAPNIQVEHWINIHYKDVLPNTKVVVTTGGGGTVLAALQAGVPLVVVPTEWDKPEIAQRVLEAGAALRLEPRHCTPLRLRAAVERVLGEASFRQNAQRLAASFAHYGGPAQAAQMLEGLSAVSPRTKKLPSDTS